MAAIDAVGGEIVALKCLGVNEPRWLAAHNNGVKLVSSSDSEMAQWVKHPVGDDQYIFECWGIVGDARWLYGATDSGELRLHHEYDVRRGTGGKWEIHPTEDSIRLKCCGKKPDMCWLNGITTTNEVKLVEESEVEEKSGTQWSIDPAEKPLPLDSDSRVLEYILGFSVTVQLGGARKTFPISFSSPGKLANFFSEELHFLQSYRDALNTCQPYQYHPDSDSKPDGELSHHLGWRSVS